MGVYFDKNSGKFRACVNIENKQIKYGMFVNPNDAFFEYKRIKEKHIKLTANKFKDKICDSVFNALINYEVSIDD